jgi:uncharacterized protein (TIGR02145 family)
MKKLISIIVWTVLPMMILAQAPGRISFQAIVRDENNDLMTDKNIGIEITITAGSESGHIVFHEVHEAVTNFLGIVNLEIGSGTIIYGNLALIKWNMGPFYIKTGIDPAGGTSYTLHSVSELTSVPFVFYANAAEKVNAPLTEIQNLARVLAFGDSAGMQIKDVTDPTDDDDVVTLNYLNGLFLTLWDTLRSTQAADIEGNRYLTVRIRDKLWMAENLRTGTYNDGTPIPLVTGDIDWSTMTTPAYCWYDNSDPNTYSAKVYGALYNWYAVNTEQLCPQNWRVPGNTDWNELFEFLGGTAEAGGKLKENGSKHWLVSDNMGTNDIQFNALPGGYRTDAFFSIGKFGKFWSSNETSVSSANSVSMVNTSGRADLIPAAKKNGISVRCVRDDRSVDL